MTDNHTELTIDLDESDMECLRHGSNVTFEFHGDNDHILAVCVGREDEELDKEWLLGEDEPTTNRITRTQWKGIAGVAITLLGAFQAAGPLVDVFPMYTGGILAVLGAMYVLDQIEREPSSASVEA